MAPDFILYVDTAILVVNKPPGLLSLQDGYDKTLPHLATVLQPEYGPLWMVHRLDRDTSGAMVVARSVQAHRSLNIQFQQRQVAKIYHALVKGRPDWIESQVSLPLRKDGDRQHRTVIDPRRGKPASTDFRVLEQFQEVTLIEACPHTGYTHQIRAHLASLGFPLLCDGLYGDGQPASLPGSQGQPLALTRMALHAFALSFVHPSSSEKVTYTAPYPADFAGMLAQLQRA